MYPSKHNYAKHLCLVTLKIYDLGFLNARLGRHPFVLYPRYELVRELHDLLFIYLIGTYIRVHIHHHYLATRNYLFH